MSMLGKGDRFPVEFLPAPPTRPTVVFFYPAALTGGCTREARRFEVLRKEFDQAGAEVGGASVDTAELNAEFCEKESLSFPLVSDPTKELAGALGILVEKGDRGLLAE